MKTRKKLDFVYEGEVIVQTPKTQKETKEKGNAKGEAIL